MALNPYTTVWILRSTNENASIELGEFRQKE